MPENDSRGRSDKPDKSDLVNEVMRRFHIPSYEAWKLTVPELTKKRES